MIRCFFTLVVLGSVGVFAQDMKSYLNFHAPIIYSTTNLPVDVPGGSIIFDVNSGVFKGLVPTGSSNNWVVLSAPSGSAAVLSTGASERIERAVINVTGASTCSIESSSGTPSWISSCTASSSIVTLTLNSGLFSALPTCTGICDVQANGHCVVRLHSGGSSTAIVVSAIDSSNGYSINDKFSLICMGPR